MSHQEAYFRKHGFYDMMHKAPTPQEAIGHAMNQINAAFGPKKKVVRIGNAEYYELKGQIVGFKGMVK